jgi:SAM-dependent methyltransferase
MKGEGDVVAARRHYFESKSANLEFLLRDRYEWMNEWIGADSQGIEIGCGTGLSREFIRSKNYKLTDYAEHEWIDVTNVNAMETPFADEAFDFVVSSNMIHHVAYPLRFFEEIARILKPGGLLLIQEINASAMMCAVLRLMQHEGYSFSANVFDRDEVCTDPADLWSANCAIPNLLFDDMAKFERCIPDFRVEHSGFSECFMLLNSGGVIAKTVSIPLPRLALRAVRRLDAALCTVAPQTFAMQRQIVLRKHA